MRKIYLWTFPARFKEGNGVSTRCNKSGFPIENVQIALVEKETVSLLPAGFAQNTCLCHTSHGGRSGWKTHLHLAGGISDREERVGLGVPIDQQGRSRSASESFNLFLVCLEELVDIPGHPHGLIGGIPYPLKEEIQPLGPTGAPAGSIETLIVELPVLLEEETEIEDRLAQNLLSTEHEGDEEPADSAISVKERMNRLELGMDEASPHQQREHWSILMEECFELSHALH
jgi:hypothetical protein